MRGIVLAGGKGTRLHPLTKICNKHLLPVGTFPMIFFSLFKLQQAGIRDVLLVTGKDDVGDFARLLGNGSDFHLNLTYRVQERAGGIAEALMLGQDFARSSPFVALLADNLFEDDLFPFLQRFEKEEEKVKLFLKEVDDPCQFGIAELKEKRIVSIEEKPAKPKSKCAVTGIYMYRPDVFEVIARLSPSSRGELEISDVNHYFVRTGEVSYEILNGWWEDAGTLESYARVNQLHHSVNFISSSMTKSS